MAPAILAELLKTTACSASVTPRDLLVGNSTGDDAAVFRLGDDRAVVATTDFFTPIVDDPGDFGCIAAANAVSDVYAMGAKPLFALNIVGMPLDKVPLDVIAAVLAGGQRLCSRVGVVIGGGHSIDSVEPIYGLAVVGEVHPGRIKSNAGAKAGDVLILSKPIGIGIIAAAVNRGAASDEAYGEMLRWATLPNTTGEKLGACAGVHALTDVTGYGLLGHLLEMCEASGVGANLRRQRVPVIQSSCSLPTAAVASAAASRNRDDCIGRVDFGVANEQEINLLCDPQTNGGLLAACSPDVVDEVLRQFRHDGCDHACVIGEVAQSSGICVI